MRDGPRGASRDCAAWVASILDPGDEPQTASELKAQPGGEAGGEARAQGAEPSDTVDNEDDSEEDADADGAETEGAAKQRRSRAPRGSLVRAWDSACAAGHVVMPLQPEESLRHTLPVVAAAAADAAAVAAAAAAAAGGSGAKPHSQKGPKHRRRQQLAALQPPAGRAGADPAGDSDGGESSGGAGTPPLWLLEPQPGLLRYGDLLSQYGDADAESVAWLELQLAAMVHVLQRREEEPAATQHQEDEGSGSGAHAGHSSRRQQPEQQPPHEQPGKAPARKKQPRLDVKLDVFFFEVVPGKPWELVPPTSAVVRNLNRAMEKEQLAQLVK